MSTLGNGLQLHVVIIKKKRKGPENERFNEVWEKKKKESCSTCAKFSFVS